MEHYSDFNTYSNGLVGVGIGEAIASYMGLLGTLHQKNLKSVCLEVHSGAFLAPKSALF